MNLEIQLHKVIEDNDRLRASLEEEKRLRIFEVLRRVPTKTLLLELLKRETNGGQHKSNN